MSLAVRPSPSFVPFEAIELAHSLTARFRSIVTRHPDRTAIKSKTQAVSYAELNRAANQVAHTILDHQGGTQNPVGLLIQQESPALAAIVGVLKAGACYVPLDRAFPRERIHSIIEDCRLKVLLTDRSDAAWARELAPAVHVIAVEDIRDEARDHDIDLAAGPDALAAIFYTSGTTGRPKGVMQSHRSVMHRVLLSTNALGIGPTDRLTLLTAPTYSASLRNVFSALLNGAALYPFLVLRDGITELGTWLGREGITVNHSVPSVFRQWASVLSGTEDISSLRLIELGGEATTVGDVELYKRFLPASCVFVNGLASNETGTITRYVIDHSTPITGNSVPVGFAVPGKDLLLLDDDGNEVPAGEVGEIAVRSRFLSPGYWNRPDLTAATFLADSARPDERTYRTGDLGSFLPDGCLIHKGRKDFRAKIRGIRVETAEVEATLQSHPAVQVAAVAIHDQHKGGHTLTAHVVFKPASPITSVDDLRTFLSGTLPDYMVPAAFVFHKTDLPRLLNGKIDRRGLSEAARARPSRSTPFEAPRDAVEWDVANIWTAVLGVHSISIHDSFVDLGGDSLSAAAVAARIEKAFNRPLPVADLVRSPTVKQLAEVLRRDYRGEPWSSLIKLQSGEGNRFVFCFPFNGGFSQELFYFGLLAPRIRPDYTFYAVVARGSDGTSSPHGSVEEMAADYIREITAIQPHGPYLLLGDCFSGAVAYETARQLRAQGQEIGTLCLFDTSGGRSWLDSWLGTSLSGRVRHHIAPARKALTRRIKGLPHHLAALRNIQGTGARVRYMVRTFRKEGRQTLSELQSQLPPDPRPALAGRSEPAASDPLRRHRSERAYDLAVRSYRRRPYDGTVTLIATEETWKANPMLGWGVDDRVEVHKVPGRHTTYMQEQAHFIGDVLRTCFEKTERAVHN